jgi:hypothetical protein
MGPTVFAAIPWNIRTHIWMKDTTQTLPLDNSVYGWPKTLKANGVDNFADAGFAFSEVDAYPAKMYLSINNKLGYVNYPSNGESATIKSGFDSNPMHIDVENKGGQDVIHFCSAGGFYKYNRQTNAEKKLLTFGEEHWRIYSNDDIAVCYRFRNKKKIIVITRDNVAVWGRSGGTWIPLLRPKRRFCYPYRVRVVELSTAGHFILYAKHAFMVLDNDTLDAVHV